jgi:hypothetical protein
MPIPGDCKWKFNLHQTVDDRRGTKCLLFHKQEFYFPNGLDILIITE